MRVRDYAAERYNRRTRAMERQADALARIAAAMEVQALASVTQTGGPGRSWTTKTASEFMDSLASMAERLAR